MRGATTCPSSNRRSALDSLQGPCAEIDSATTCALAARSFAGAVPEQVPQRAFRVPGSLNGSLLARAPIVSGTYDESVEDIGELGLASRRFFARDAVVVAPSLLGCVLRRTEADVTVSMRITEVEAYAGDRDPGSHSYRGATKRNRSMFGPPGHLYCYFTYGLHHAMNITVGESGEPSACLIRAGAIMDGADEARRRRERRPRKAPLTEPGLARGPGCVAQCFGVDLRNDGDDLLSGQWRFFVPRDERVLAHQIGPRVGVSGPGGDASRFSWRFWLAGAPSVSAYKPGRLVGSNKERIQP